MGTVKRLEIPDPNGIEIEKRLDNLTLWPVITIGNIFAFILRKKDFNTDYIGKYKDQKAYSYFDSGFAGQYLFMKQRVNIVFLHSGVRASQAVNEQKQIWIVVKKIHENGSSNILSACALIWQAPSKLAGMLLLPYIKLHIHTQMGGVILHLLILHVSGTKGPEKKLNQNPSLTYLFGKTWEASMQTLMMRIERKLSRKT